MSPDQEKAYSSPSLLCVCGVPCSAGESGAVQMNCSMGSSSLLSSRSSLLPFSILDCWAHAQRLLKLKMLLWAERGRGLAHAESLSHVPNSPLQQGCRLTLSCAPLSTEGIARCSPELVHGSTCMRTSSRAPQLRASEKAAS